MCQYAVARITAEATQSLEGEGPEYHTKDGLQGMKTARISSRRGKLTDHELSSLGEECDLSVVSDTFGFLIRAAQLQTFRKFHLEFKDTGLTPPSYAALAIVGANPGIRQGFVGSLLGFREPNMTKLVKELSAAGLLGRVRREQDKRATGLELTGKGFEFMTEMNCRAAKLDQLHTSSLSKPDRETLMRLLKSVLKNGYGQVADLVEFHD